MRNRVSSLGLALLLALTMQLPALGGESPHYQVVGHGDAFDWRLLYDASGHTKIPGDLKEAYEDLRKMLPESASKMFDAAYQYAVKKGHPDDEETWSLMSESLDEQLHGETSDPESVLLNLMNGLVFNWRLAGEGKLPSAFRSCGISNKFDMATSILQGYGRSLSGSTQNPNKVCDTVTEQLKQAVSCLVSADFVREYTLKPLGLKMGDWAWVRYYQGSIPGTGETPGEYYVVVYSRDSKHGRLLLALPNQQGGFEAVMNAYDLTREGSQWTADEGNGGYKVYEAMGRFVTKLSNEPRYYVHLVPGGSKCTPDE